MLAGWVGTGFDLEIIVGNGSVPVAPKLGVRV